MTYKFVTIEVAPDKNPRGIGEAEFDVAPRAGEFVDMKPEKENDRVMFEVIAVAHIPTGGKFSGDLHLIRIGRSAEFHAAVAHRVAGRSATTP